DVLYIKVREETRVVSKSCHIAIGINEQGDREVIGLMIENGESESTWNKFFNYLKDRGLQETELVISDAHQGLLSAIQQSFVGAYSDEKKYEKACQTLDEGFEDAFQYTVVGQGHSRLKSTNVLERLNQEVRRREKVVRIFPNTDSANRLIGAVLIDIHDE